MIYAQTRDTQRVTKRVIHANINLKNDQLEVVYVYCIPCLLSFLISIGAQPVGPHCGLQICTQSNKNEHHGENNTQLLKLNPICRELMKTPLKKCPHFILHRLSLWQRFLSDDVIIRLHLIHAFPLDDVMMTSQQIHEFPADDVTL